MSDYFKKLDVYFILYINFNIIAKYRLIIIFNYKFLYFLNIKIIF